jgi:hypothetical protein
MFGMICDKNGNEKQAGVLDSVNLVTGANCKWLSITRILKQGWKFDGDNNMMWLTKDVDTMVFDVVVNTNKGMLFLICIKRNNEMANATVSDPEPVSITIQEAHAKLGHGGEEKTRRAAQALGWEIKKGGLTPCEACADGKSKQKNIPKESDHVEYKVSGGCVFLDISTVKVYVNGPKVYTSNWLMIVDERTNLKLSSYHEKKDGIVEMTCEKFHKWQKAGIP